MSLLFCKSSGFSLSKITGDFWLIWPMACWHQHNHLASSVHSTHGHMVYANELICSLYVSILPHWCTLINLELWHLCCISVAYLLLAYFCSHILKMLHHIAFWWIYAVMWGLYVDCSRNAVGNTCAMWQAYLLRGICGISLPVFLVILLIALGSYEGHILK